jgi:two-component system phosphate regulon response regulator PhoB
MTSQPDSGKRVLLVEDDADARDIYGTNLRVVGFQVDEATTLADAAACVKTKAPDIVVLDCRLPDGDGIELARRWRGAPETKDLPIVMLTASADRQDIEAANLAVVDAFIVKPCTGDALVKRVRETLVAALPTRRLRRYVH